MIKNYIMEYQKEHDSSKKEIKDNTRIIGRIK